MSICDHKNEKKVMSLEIREESISQAFGAESVRLANLGSSLVSQSGDTVCIRLAQLSLILYLMT